MRVLRPTDEAIREASAALRTGLLVALPTETVYGLGADARNDAALKRLYEAKGRPTQHPVIVHLANADQIDEWAVDVPEAARRLAAQLWPGPLTMILRKAGFVSLSVTGGQDTVGLRIPSHPVARKLLLEFGGGVAAPSANKFGRISPTTADDVAHDFEEEVEIVLDGGTCEVGIESTIVDLTGDQLRILRPGMILPEQIEAIAGKVQRAPAPGSTTRAPGMLKSHYAPRTPTELVTSEKFSARLRELQSSGRKVCALTFQAQVGECAGLVVASVDPRRYAHELYGSLRKLDRLGADVILVESVPEDDAWSGVADRLKRAAADCSSRG